MIIELKDFKPYSSTFYFHWVDENGRVVEWHDTDSALKCVKWCAFCTRCSHPNRRCVHGKDRFVGASEAATHSEAAHLLNTMALQHINCPVVFNVPKALLA
jgi:hypothetical protein